MGNSLRKEEEMRVQRSRYLHMSKEEKRLAYPDGHVTVDQINNWQEYSTAAMLPEPAGSAYFDANRTINSKVSLWQGDITRLEIDGIVNSAYTSNRGEVNSRIIVRAGGFYQDEVYCYGLKPRGEVLVTGGYKLPAKYVLNTIAPRFANVEVLKNCYENCLEAAKDQGIKTVAFPCIATKKYGGFKTEDGALVALNTVRQWMNNYHTKVDRVIFCVYSREDFTIYSSLMQQFFPMERHSASDAFVALNITDDDDEDDSLLATSAELLLISKQEVNTIIYDPGAVSHKKIVVQQFSQKSRLYIVHDHDHV